MGLSLTLAFITTIVGLVLLFKDSGDIEMIPIVGFVILMTTWPIFYYTLKALGYT